MSRYDSNPDITRLSLRGRSNSLENKEKEKEHLLYSPAILNRSPRLRPQTPTRMLPSPELTPLNAYQLSDPKTGSEMDLKLPEAAIDGLEKMEELSL